MDAASGENRPKRAGMQHRHARGEDFFCWGSGDRVTACQRLPRTAYLCFQPGPGGGSGPVS